MTTQELVLRRNAIKSVMKQSATHLKQIVQAYEEKKEQMKLLESDLAEVELLLSEMLGTDLENLEASLTTLATSAMN